MMRSPFSGPSTPPELLVMGGPFTDATAAAAAQSVAGGQAGTNECDTEKVAHTKAITLIDAKINAIRQLATEDDEARQELLELQSKRQEICEKLCNLKSPSDQLKIKTAALIRQEAALKKAKEDLEEWMVQKDVLEAKVRDCKHAVDKLAIEKWRPSKEPTFQKCRRCLSMTPPWSSLHS